MHAQYPARETLRQQIERIQRELDTLFADINCRFGRCRQPATVITLTRTSIGARVDLLCKRHAHRPREVAEVLDEWAIKARWTTIARSMSTTWPPTLR